MPDAATAEPEVLYDVLSTLDDNDLPRLNNCTLQIGEVALEFKNGRAKVPLSHAPEVARHPLVTIPGYDGPVAPAVPNASAELPTMDREQQGSPEERAARVRAAAEYLRSEGVEVPVVQPTASPAEDPARKALEERVAELEELVRQATLLGDDGKPAQDGEKEGTKVAKKGAKASSGKAVESSSPAAEEEKIPDGFDAKTADGKPRCWARKGNGEQCTNASVDGGHACGLPAHQKLLAK